MLFDIGLVVLNLELHCFGFRLSNYLLPFATSYLGCCLWAALSFAIDTRPPSCRKAIIQEHGKKKLTKEEGNFDSNYFVFIKT